MKGLALIVGAGGIGTQIAKDLSKSEKDLDIVLIAGKGHEDYQILNDKVINFDDRKIAYKLLKEKSKSQ